MKHAKYMMRSSGNNQNLSYHYEFLSSENKDNRMILVEKLKANLLDMLVDNWTWLVINVKRRDIEK